MMGYAMRLDADMVERALDQFEAEALPNDHPAIPKLNEVFVSGAGYYPARITSAAFSAIM
jgi:hypothetical protein